MPDSQQALEDAVTQKFSQSDFSGGMRRNVDPSRLDSNEYPFLSNGRTRYGKIRTIRKPKNLTPEIPGGHYQSIFGYGTFLLVFVNGGVFVRDFFKNVNFFSLIPTFTMDADVDVIYTAAVPASWSNQQRCLISNETIDNTGNIITPDTLGNSKVKFFNDISGNPACLVCQDGKNQGRLIFPDGSSRLTKTASQWQNVIGTNGDEREYVPIGKQMAYHDSILYIVSVDGTEIYRSVTGRPLDFIVAIDKKGNKLIPLASGKEEAARLSFKVDFNAITCLASIPTISAGPGLGPPFYVGTSQASYMVTPDYNDTVYGEPKFRKQTLFPTGPINQFSLTDILGDTALIDPAGIRSFNAVRQLTNEGKNAPIYDDIHDLFEDITQINTAAYTFDDYALFAVATIYGNGILIRDNLRQKFVSLDIYPDVIGNIKQFAEIKVAGIRKLFFITTGNQLFEMYGDIVTAPVSLYTREITTGREEVELLPKRSRFIFENVVESGVVTAAEYVNRKAGDNRPANITANLVNQTIPLAPPFGVSNEDTTADKTISFDISRRGNKVGLYATFNFKAELSEIILVADTRERAVSEKEEGIIYNESGLS